MPPSPRSSERPADVAERIRGFVEGTILDPHARVDGDTPLLDGLIDSTGLMELLVFVEDEFGVTLDYGDIDEENFGSIDRLRQLIERRFAEGTGQ
jgi:acyl carrier protein